MSGRVTGVKFLVTLLLTPLLAESQTLKDEPTNDQTAPIPIVLEYLVNTYQQRIAVNSTKRCPFKISCSSFLLHEITEEGLVRGLALFFDRYFYRENRNIYDKYELVIDSIILFDDSLDENYLSYIYPR